MNSVIDEGLVDRLSLSVDNVDGTIVSESRWNSEKTDKQFVVVAVRIADRVTRVAVSAATTIAVGANRDKLSVCLSQDWSTRLS